MVAAMELKKEMLSVEGKYHSLVKSLGRGKQLVEYQTRIAEEHKLLNDAKSEFWEYLEANEAKDAKGKYGASVCVVEAKACILALTPLNTQLSDTVQEILAMQVAKEKFLTAAKTQKAARTQKKK